MKRWGAIILVMAGLALPAIPAASAQDRIVLKDGRVLEGNIAAQYETGYFFQTEEGLERIEMSQIESIQFAPRLMRRTEQEPKAEEEVSAL